MNRRHRPPTAAPATTRDLRPAARVGRRALASLALVVAMALPAASAAEISIAAGASWSGASDPGSTRAGFLQVAPEGGFTAWQGRLQVRPVATVGVVAGRDKRTRGHRDVWLAGAGVRIARPGHGANHWFWESLVLAGSRDTPTLSGHVQFANGFGYAHGAWEVKARHISNAGLHKPNHGETMLLVGYRF